MGYLVPGALVNQRAVCNGYAKAASLLLQELGIENRLIYGSYHRIPHTWNEFIINGEKRYMDITLSDAGLNKRYFNLTEKEMLEDHVTK